MTRVFYNSKEREGGPHASRINVQTKQRRQDETIPIKVKEEGREGSLERERERERGACGKSFFVREVKFGRREEGKLGDDGEKCLWTSIAVLDGPGVPRGR
jgi:hypothetical protein